MKKVYLIFLFLIISIATSAQQECWLMLKYKGNSPETPASYDSSSLPVNNFYVEQIKKHGAVVLNRSRWLNAVYIRAKKNVIAELQKLSFVSEVIYPGKYKIDVCTSPPEDIKLNESDILKKQIEMMQGDKFIAQGYNGRGIKIGVLDVGFAGYRKTKELDHLIKNGKIIEYKEFSDVNVRLNLQRSHGTEVLSCLAGKSDTLNMGLATEAEYYLATYQKVSDLIEALEWFEEKGVKILNNSTKLDFGYYDKEDLDGEHVLATKALSRAASSGILIFTSMGNEGDTYWRSLVAPSDARGVISVGSVSAETELRSNFTSLGPTYDRRMKPELCGVGEAMVANQVRMNKENGTSFATPLLAGFAACVWQMFPSLTKDEVYNHLLKSGSLYPYFDYAHGYGVPRAGYFFKLKSGNDTSKLKETLLLVDKNDTIFFCTKERPLVSSISGPEFIPKRTQKNVTYNGKVIKREGKFGKKAENEDLNGRDYVFYHIADEQNRLKKYVVLKLENENIFYLPKKSLKSGYKVRVFYDGYMLEVKL